MRGTERLKHSKMRFSHPPPPFFSLTQRNLTFSCVETHSFPVFFNATSFLQLPGRAGHNVISLSFQFRTWNADGLLLFSNLDDGTLEISLEDGKVAAHVNVTTGGSRVDLLSGELPRRLLSHCDWKVRSGTAEGVGMLPDRPFVVLSRQVGSSPPLGIVCQRRFSLLPRLPRVQ